MPPPRNEDILRALRARRRNAQLLKKSSQISYQSKGTYLPIPNLTPSSRALRSITQCGTHNCRHHTADTTVPPSLHVPFVRTTQSLDALDPFAPLAPLTSLAFLASLAFARLPRPSCLPRFSAHLARLPRLAHLARQTRSMSSRRTAATLLRRRSSQSTSTPGATMARRSASSSTSTSTRSFAATFPPKTPSQHR